MVADGLTTRAVHAKVVAAVAAEIVARAARIMLPTCWAATLRVPMLLLHRVQTTVVLARMAAVITVAVSVVAVTVVSVRAVAVAADAAVTVVLVAPVAAAIAADSRAVRVRAVAAAAAARAVAAAPAAAVSRG